MSKIVKKCNTCKYFNKCVAKGLSFQPTNEGSIEECWELATMDNLEPIEGKGCSNCGQAGCKRTSSIKGSTGEPICWVPIVPADWKAIQEVAVKMFRDEVPDKQDNGKERWDLLQWAAVNEVVKVCTYGSKKYSDNNWKQGKGLHPDRLFAACMRHLYAKRAGQDNDPESGLPHLAHAAWNLLAMLELEIREQD